jgi:hypothetical protein
LTLLAALRTGAPFQASTGSDTDKRKATPRADRYFLPGYVWHITHRLPQHAKTQLVYHPVTPLKIVLLGHYNVPPVESELAEACERNVQFMTLTASIRPHFTTMQQEITGIFRT